MPRHGAQRSDKWCAWCRVWIRYDPTSFGSVQAWRADHLNGACIGLSGDEPRRVDLVRLRDKANEDCEGGDCGWPPGVECGPCVARSNLAKMKTDHEQAKRDRQA